MKGETLLSGNISVQLVRLSAPLLVGSILQQLYNTVDALVIGQYLGTAAFAAVGVAGTVMNLFIFIVNGFTVGLSVIFGQRYGMGDLQGFREETFVSLCYGTIGTAALGLLGILLLPPLLRGIRTPADLIPLIQTYMLYVFCGLPAAYLYNLLSNILRSVGNTRSALYFLIISVVLNIALDYGFVGYLKTGIGGAALATVLSQAVSALLCWIYLFKTYRELLCTRADAGRHPVLFKETLHYGLASALHQSSLYIGKLLVQGAVNTLGTSAIAAYTAATRIEGYANSFGTSGSQAMSVFVSQNRGADNEERVRAGFKRGMLLMAALGVAASIVLFVGAGAFMRGLMPEEGTEAVSMGTGYLKFMGVFYVFCFLGNSYVGCFRGIGKVSVPVVGTTIQIVLRVILSDLLAAKYGLTAVAIASIVGWAVMLVYQTYMAVKAFGLPKLRHRHA